jgi:hypothetical protein
MRFKHLILSLLGAILFLSSCDNELDVNADYKDVPVVFGLLNIDETEHFVRVSRVFLGEGDALAFAQSPDSLYYKPEDIEVKIEEVISGNVTRSWILEYRTDIPKDEGTFANPFQVLYSFEVPENNKLKTNALYQLTLKNLKNGNLLTGGTRLAQKVNLLTPSNFLSTVEIFPQQTTFVKWRTTPNGRLHEVVLRFMYREHPDGQPDQEVRKVVEINLGRSISQDDLGNEERTKQIENRVFYQTLSAFIPPSSFENPVLRYADSLQFVVNVGDDDLYTYLNVNQPSNTVAQERPQFNNVLGGLGLFASRSIFSRTYYIGDITIDSLRNNPVTEPLNFQDR